MLCLREATLIGSSAPSRHLHLQGCEVPQNPASRSYDHVSQSEVQRVPVDALQTRSTYLPASRPTRPSNLTMLLRFLFCSFQLTALPEREAAPARLPSFQQRSAPAVRTDAAASTRTTQQCRSVANVRLVIPSCTAPPSCRRASARERAHFPVPGRWRLCARPTLLPVLAGTTSTTAAMSPSPVTPHRVPPRNRADVIAHVPGGHLVPEPAKDVSRLWSSSDLSDAQEDEAQGVRGRRVELPYKSLACEVGAHGAGREAERTGHVVFGPGVDWSPGEVDGRVERTCKRPWPGRVHGGCALLTSEAHASDGNFVSTVRTPSSSIVASAS